jgi:hypothetical protein
MTDITNTPYSNQCAILGDLWLTYKQDEEFADFIEYNDIGLPLAFAIAEGIIPNAPMAEQYIRETWKLFLEGLKIEDTGFQSLDEILGL